ncbi:hypothetical protein [Thiohalorhabdus methylotrophus]|uniref:EF-hand domain-containing protein n=1 Tax=Thiohalorhabdus methylotrophus TaxID=3242694 RepID=A0ABV4TXG3_9GAMM
MARLLWSLVLLAPFVACTGKPIDPGIAARAQPLGFDRLDLDRDGYLSPKEAKRALDLPGLVTRADTDRDGKVDRQELHRYVHGGLGRG